MQVLITRGILKLYKYQIQALLILTTSKINIKKLNLLPKDIIQTKGGKH